MVNDWGFLEVFASSFIAGIPHDMWFVEHQRRRASSKNLNVPKVPDFPGKLWCESYRTHIRSKGFPNPPEYSFNESDPFFVSWDKHKRRFKMAQYDRIMEDLKNIIWNSAVLQSTRLSTEFERTGIFRSLLGIKDWCLLPSLLPSTSVVFCLHTSNCQWLAQGTPIRRRKSVIPTSNVRRGRFMMTPPLKAVHQPRTLLLLPRLQDPGHKYRILHPLHNLPH